MEVNGLPGGENVEVVGDAEHIGTVDHLEGDMTVKLTHYSSRSGQFHRVPVDWIDHIVGGKLWHNQDSGRGDPFLASATDRSEQRRSTVHGGIPL